MEYMEQYKTIQTQLTFDEIINIYEHKYKNYDEYMKSMEKYFISPEIVEDKNMVIMRGMFRPLIIDEESFNYLFNKGGALS